MKQVKTVGEISSSKLVTIRLDSTVVEAQTLMSERRFRHLPVVNELGEIVGILSDRDVQRASTVARTPNSVEFTQTLDPKILVKDFMSWPVHSVTSDITVRDVALRMLNEKISALMVKDVNGILRGIVTTDDLIRYLISLLDKDPSRLRLAVDAVFEEFSSAGNWN